MGLKLFSLLGSSLFQGCFHFWGHLHFWVDLHVWNHRHCTEGHWTRKCQLMSSLVTSYNNMQGCQATFSSTEPSLQSIIEVCPRLKNSWESTEYTLQHGNYFLSIFSSSRLYDPGARSQEPGARMNFKKPPAEWRGLKMTICSMWTIPCDTYLVDDWCESHLARK